MKTRNKNEGGPRTSLRPDHGSNKAYRRERRFHRRPESLGVDYQLFQPLGIPQSAPRASQEVSPISDELDLTWKERRHEAARRALIALAFLPFIVVVLVVLAAVRPPLHDDLSIILKITGLSH